MFKRNLLGAMFGFSLCAMPAVAQDMSHENGHKPVVDERTALVLNAEERAIILLEMRQFLTGVQVMTEGLARDDMKAVAQASSALGMKTAHAVPAPLKEKLPKEFKQLGFAVHSEFDQIAMDAESLGDVKHTMTQFAGTLNKCVACHNIYQIQSEHFPPLKK